MYTLARLTISKNLLIEQGNMVGPTMFGVVASVVALEGVQTDVTTPNNFGTCIASWKDITQKTHAKWACVSPAMLEELKEKLCKRIQHCCAMLRRSRNKRHIGSC